LHANKRQLTETRITVLKKLEGLISKIFTVDIGLSFSGKLIKYSYYG